MKELYSNRRDCLELAKELNQKLGTKINFTGLFYQEVPSGKYHCLPYNRYESYQDYEKDVVSFYYKFCKDGFLRIGVGDYNNRSSLGHKLAALSDLYGVLKEKFGEPTVFYTTKNDDENMLNFEWAFCDKEEVVKSFENGTVFDDDEIDELIIIDSEYSSYNGHLSESARTFFEENIGLPFLMQTLIEEDIEDYVKYKKGKKITCPDGVRVDFVEVTSLDKKYKRQKIK